MTQKGELPKCIWLTGLPAAGKTTIAYGVERRLRRDGFHACVLDGDRLRVGLSADLGYSEEDRTENIRRVAHVARLMVDAGVIVLVALVSPFQAGRQMARGLFREGEFVEVFVDTPLEECELRDPKGMYAQARRGELRLFTGIESPYEPPKDPEVRVRTCHSGIEECVAEVHRYIVGNRSS